MPHNQIIDHLFRHQYGKLVAILIRIFGIENLELVEDVVQDTFYKAMLSWRKEIPENPEAWLTKSAKNRAIDLIRKSKSSTKREQSFASNLTPSDLEDIFLENEIEDSQLRMIFTACHPILKPKDQIAFALKTISGFSTKEIASALLVKPETIKKSLVRARKSILENNIKFEIPSRENLQERIDRVHEVIYLIFNEGFHSTQTDFLIRKDLCAEALRLCKILLQKDFETKSITHALFALMCFHSARLESKINHLNELISLKDQNRKLWHQPLIILGNQHMHKAVENSNYSTYHYEAAIVAEHLKAANYADTDFKKILMWYQKLYEIQPNDLTLLNIAIVYLEMGNNALAYKTYQKINPISLHQRTYLYHSFYGEYLFKIGQHEMAIQAIDIALTNVKNKTEKNYLIAKKEYYCSQYINVKNA